MVAENPSAKPRYESIQKWEDTWAAYQDLFSGVRAAIDQRLRQGQIVVIDGPFGVGKTSSIANPLYEQREGEGYVVGDWSGDYEDEREAATRSRYIETRVLPALLGDAEKRFFLLDEFPALLRANPQNTEHLLQTLHDRRIETLLVNTGRTQAIRDEANQKLLELSEEAGIPIVIHKMEITHVPPEIVRAHLKQVNGAEQDLIDFVLDPANEALLVPQVFNAFVEDSKSMDDLRKRATNHQWWFFPNCLGGSKEAMVRALQNLGIKFPDRYLQAVRDYN